MRPISCVVALLLVPAVIVDRGYCFWKHRGLVHEKTISSQGTSAGSLSWSPLHRANTKLRSLDGGGWKDMEVGEEERRAEAFWGKVLNQSHLFWGPYSLSLSFSKGEPVTMQLGRAAMGFYLRTLSWLSARWVFAPPILVVGTTMRRATIVEASYGGDLYGYRPACALYWQLSATLFSCRRLGSRTRNNNKTHPR